MFVKQRNVSAPDWAQWNLERNWSHLNKKRIRVINSNIRANESQRITRHVEHTSAVSHAASRDVRRSTGRVAALAGGARSLVNLFLAGAGPAVIMIELSNSALDCSRASEPP